MTTQQRPPHGSQYIEQLFTRLENYPWSADYEFQAGLAAILGQPSIVASPTPVRIPADDSNRDLHLRARCFYFARKFPEQTGPSGVDFDAYGAWRSRQHADNCAQLELTNPPPSAPSAPSSLDTTPEKPQAASSITFMEANGHLSPSPSPSRAQHDSTDQSMFEPVPSWQKSTLASASTSSPSQHLAEGDLPSGEELPPALSFQEIKALIEEGKPIPGIKDIPNTVLEGQGSEAQLEKRRKPWESGSSRAESGLTDLLNRSQEDNTG